MKKRILFIHASLGGGGAERVLIDILRNFDYSQYDVDLVLMNGTGVYLNDIPRHVNYLGSIYAPKRGLIKRALAKFRLNWLFEPLEIKRLVKSQYDTIISFMESYPLRYHSYIRNYAKNNVTWVHTDLSIHHWSKERFFSSAHESSVYSSMDRVVLVSQKALSSFREFFNYEKDNLIVINNPIDKQRISYLAEAYLVKKDVFTFVTVGRLSYQKRYDRLLRAVKALKVRGCNFCLNILGTGELEKEIKALIDELTIGDCVHLIGFNRNPYPYIKNSDAFILSSDTEGYPTVICEAMTLGIPIIGTRVTGILDLCGNSEYGLLTDLTPEALTEAMFLFYSSPQILKDYSCKALERSLSLSLDYAMNRIYSIL